MTTAVVSFPYFLYMYVCYVNAFVNAEIPVMHGSPTHWLFRQPIKRKLSLTGKEKKKKAETTGFRKADELRTRLV